MLEIVSVGWAVLQQRDQINLSFLIFQDSGQLEQLLIGKTMWVKYLNYVTCFLLEFNSWKQKAVRASS